MFKPLGLFIGARYIANRQGKGFTSFISASSTIGIGLGVMILILVLSAMNGFERALAQHLLSIVPHAELMSVNEPIEDWQKVVEKAQQNSNVIAAAPIIKMQGMLQKRQALKGVEVRGVDPLLETNVSSVANYIIEGDWKALNNNNGVVIGAGVAKKLKVSIGDTIQMLLPPKNNQTNSNTQISALTRKSMKVVAVFKFGGEIDSNQVYISLNQARQLIGFKIGQVQGIRLSVNDIFKAPIITRNVAYSIDAYLYIFDWTRSQGHLYKDIQLVRLVMFIVLILVIAVASFNIVSTLIMSVNEKKSDIAILKTMGAPASTVLVAFIIQGLTNGILGCLMGGALGVYLSINLTEFSMAIETALGMKFLSDDVYFIDFLPTYVKQADVVITVVTALCLTFIATIYPALQATKVEPAQVLGQL